VRGGREGKQGGSKLDDIPFNSENQNQALLSKEDNEEFSSLGQNRV
jgi:hypothetical protein